jgi:ABC-type branched-subunit amino acid transport system substrate-binding protein
MIAPSRLLVFVRRPWCWWAILLLASLFLSLSSLPFLAAGQLVPPPPPSLPTYTIGLLYSGSGVWSGTGVRTKQVMQLWQDVVNNKPAIGFQVNIVLADIRSDASLIWPMSDYLMTQNVSFMIAPESTLSVIASQYVNRPQVRVPIISRVSLSDQYRCGTVASAYPTNGNWRRANDRAFAYASTVLQPASVQFRDYYALTRNNGAGTAAIVYFDDNFHTETCVAGAYYARVNKMKVAVSHVIRSNYTSNSLRDIIIDLKARNPDVVTWCRRTGCKEDIAMMNYRRWIIYRDRS